MNEKGFGGARLSIEDVGDGLAVDAKGEAEALIAIYAMLGNELSRKMGIPVEMLAAAVEKSDALFEAIAGDRVSIDRSNLPERFRENGR